MLAALLGSCGGDGGSPPSQPRSAGEIDTAFGEGGIRRLSYPASADDVRIDSQGRVLLASHHGPLNEALFTRVLPEGGWDQSLFRRMPATLGGPYDAAAYPLGDGRFMGVLRGSPVVAGPAGVGHLAASRFEAQGVLDHTYGLNGTAIFQTRSIYDVVAGADGSLTVLGSMTPLSSPTGAAQIGRLDAAGQRVPAYERNAEGALAVCGESVALLGYRGALQQDNRLVLAVRPSYDRWCVVRLNTDGTLDGTFGQAGRADPVEPARIGPGAPLAVLLDVDGAITIVARTQSAAPSSRPVTVLVWLTSSGQLDTTRGAQGFLQLPFDFAIGEPLAAAMQADGKLLLAGYPYFVSFGVFMTDFTKPRVARLDRQGNLDTSFGSGTGAVLLEAGGNRLLPKRVIASNAGTIYVAGGAVPAGPTNDLGFLSLAVMKLFTGER